MSDNGKPISLNREGISEKRSSPTKDALRQFKRNRIAVVGFFVILFFVFIAVTANLWTSAGVLDHPKGYRASHVINPKRWTRVDNFADPMTCARDNIDQGKSWCAMLSPQPDSWVLSQSAVV